MTSSVTSPIDSARPISYRLPVVNTPLSPVVSEIFSVENGRRHARRHDVPHADIQNATRYTPQPSAGELCAVAAGGGGHGRIQTGATGGTCPLQTNGCQGWLDRDGFVNLAGYIPKCTKTCMKSHKIAYVLPKIISGKLHM